jgi:hypothetical protein
MFIQCKSLAGKVSRHKNLNGFENSGLRGVRKDTAEKQHPQYKTVSNC